MSIASSDGAVRLTNDVTVVTIQGGGSKSLVYSVYHMRRFKLDWFVIIIVAVMMCLCAVVTVGFIAGSLMVMEGATERTCVRVNGSMVGRTIMLNLNTSGMHACMYVLSE